MPSARCVDDVGRGMAVRQLLITGGAGFLGMHLAECFQREGLRVRLLDWTERVDWARDPGLEYVRGDIRDPAAVEVALAGVDSVIHTAFASPRKSRDVLYSVNVEGARTLCAAAHTQGVRRLVWISSTIVTQPPRPHPFLPNSPLSRLDRYRAVRAEAEAVAAEWATRGLSIAIVRPKTFLGPGRVGAFAILFDAIRRGRTVPVLGGGRNRYQLLDIRDMAEGIRLLEGSDAQGVFEFGAADFGTVSQDLQALIDYAGTGARLRFMPGWLARGAMRAAEIANFVPFSEWHHASARSQDSVVDTLRAVSELGWQPRSSNIQALQAAYDWYAQAMVTTGTAKTTHPVPLGHRVLERLYRMVLG